MNPREAFRDYPNGEYVARWLMEKVYKENDYHETPIHRYIRICYLVAWNRCSWISVEYDSIRPFKGLLGKLGLDKSEAIELLQHSTIFEGISMKLKGIVAW